MPLLRDPWHEWILDNPFLQRDLRRWHRRANTFRCAAWCACLPALAVPAVLVLYATVPSVARVLLPPVPGPAMLFLAALLHFAAARIAVAALPTLQQEAAADRFDFLRMLPMRHRELLLKIGIARSILVLGAALAAAPVYLVILTFGGLATGDVLALLALLTAVLVAPPTAIEVIGARSLRRAATPTAPNQLNVNPRWIFWMVAIQAVFQGALLRGISSRRAPHGRRHPSAAVGSALGLFPFGLALLLLRLLWEPKGFFAWHLTPLLPLALVWAIVRAAQTTAVAELWAREAVPEDLPKGRVAVTFPEETGRPDERHTTHRLHLLALGVLAFAMAGYLWHPLVTGSTRGAPAGHAPGAGPAGRLFLLWGWILVMRALDRMRWQCLSAAHPRGETLIETAAALARSLAVIAGAVLLACVPGRVMPWPGLPLVALKLVPCALVSLAFGGAWRAALGKAPRLFHAGTQMLLSLLDLFTYVAPILVLAWARDARWHLAASLSPVYALCALLSSAWHGTSPLRWEARLLMPLLPAGGMALRARRRRPRRAADRPARAGHDRMERWLEQRLEQCDNPLLSLEWRRQLRRPTGLFLRTAGSVLTALLLSGGFLALIWRIPMHGAGRSPALMLMGLGLAVLLTAMIAGMQVATGIGLEYTTAMTQRRIPFLFLSSLSDREIVLGTVGARALPVFPALMAGGAAVLLWMGIGQIGGLPWWAPLAEAGGSATIAAGMAHMALRMFHSWGRFDWVRILVALLPQAPMMLIMGVNLTHRRPGLLSWMTEYRAALAIALAAAAMLLVAALPRSLRSATAAVHACRSGRDVDGKAGKG